MPDNHGTIISCKITFFYGNRTISCRHFYIATYLKTNDTTFNGLSAFCI